MSSPQLSELVGQQARASHRRIEHVLIFFHALGVGGGERVTCALAEIWQSIGIKVTIVTDVPLDQSRPSQSLPKGVKHRVIPDYNTISGETYSNRSTSLCEVINETQADAIVFAHWFAESLPFDLLLCRANGLKTFLFVQSLFSQFFLDDLGIHTLDIPYCYSLADAVICLSNTDRFIWQQFNPNTYVTCNPITLPPTIATAPLTGHTVLWPARLHPDKCPERVIPIMKELINLVPDAIVQMVGSLDEPFATHFSSLVEEAELGNHIVLMGEQKPEDMPAFYQQADAFLLTSRREGWSLALAEAMASGLPCVIYNLPYLTLVQNNPAIISVEQGDHLGAAQELARLLTDKTEAARRGALGKSFIEQIANYNHGLFWKELFDTGKVSSQPSENADEGRIANTAVKEAFAAHKEYVSRSCAKDLHINNLTIANADLTRQRDELLHALRATESSVSFRLGSALTCIPRKLRKALSK